MVDLDLVKLYFCHTLITTGKKCNKMLTQGCLDKGLAINLKDPAWFLLEMYANVLHLPPIHRKTFLTKMFERYDFFST